MKNIIDINGLEHYNKRLLALINDIKWDTFFNVGDIVYYDGNNIVSIDPNKYDSALGVAIGVIVIPEAFAIDKKIRIIALQNASDNNNAYLPWDNDKNAANKHLLTLYNSLPITDNTSIDIVSSEQHGSLPSDMESWTGKYSYVDKNSSRYHVTTDLYIPSPYQSGNSNENYYKELSNGNALSDFNGFYNTQILVTFSKSFKAANACWNYKDNANINLQWYLPGMGELGYMIARLSKLNESIVHAGGSAMVSNVYWSSTEYYDNAYSEYNAYKLLTLDGKVNPQNLKINKNSNGYSRAFCSLDPNDIINTRIKNGNFFYCESKELFNSALNSENLSHESVVFINDEKNNIKEIWTNDVFFNGNYINTEDIETAISEIYESINFNVANINDKLSIINTNIDKKQNVLISGSNIKTISNQSLIGNGNIPGNYITYPIINHYSNDTTFNITPNILHIWCEVEELNITLADKIPNIANEYIFQFISGDTPTQLSLPNTIQWTDGRPPIIEANKPYQVSIMNDFVSITNDVIGINDKTENYLTMVALEDGLNASFSGIDSIYYSIDNCETWNILNNGESTSDVLKDQKISFKANLRSDDRNLKIGTFSVNKKFKLTGNCMSILFGDEAKLNNDLTGCSFRDLFKNCTKLQSVSNKFLPATTLEKGCYSNMFYGCSSLTKAPELPAIVLTEDCYNGMFSGCTSLTQAPELPATTLEWSCYESMFSGCTSLTQAPELPATVILRNCYYNMFRNCSSLINAPELPAINLAQGCYYCMFYGCSSLTKAPELPAIYIDKGCYEGMFYGCSSLTKAPELPATFLISVCYCEMFSGCTSLTQAPELPATTLTDKCYKKMFSGCTSLTQAPELPATNATTECYYEMFSGCTSLTQAPELPATTLAQNCYVNMFSGCTSLTTAPELPAINLAQGCYYGMFHGCSSLTTAPELPATNLAPECYVNMFYGCSNINFIKALFKLIGINNTSNWLYGVSDTGIFVKNIGAKWDDVGPDGVPEGWTTYTNDIENINFCTITALENNVNVKININEYEYSINNYYKWNDLPENTNIVLNKNEKMFIKNKGLVSTNLRKFTITGNFSLSGNSLSLVYGNNLNESFSLELNTSRCFKNLFQGCRGLKSVSAEFLPATTLSANCYEGMFSGCSSLTAAPQLPATVLTSSCYKSMFSGCYSLTTAPELPATTLANNCYEEMFSGCSSLTAAPQLPATTLKPYSYRMMFSGCSSLTAAPQLPAIVLAQSCYSTMFNYCTSLTTAPELPATELATDSYFNMFSGCSSLTTAPELPATSLKYGCYYGMFYGCSSLTTAPELPATNPATECYYEMFSNCSSLTAAPELPATDLTDADYCYSNMFSNCILLTQAPELPATTLSVGCYYDMFSGCTSLTTAPELPATTLVDRCYYNMFSDCSNLNYIKAMFTTTPNSLYTASWVYGVYDTGTFVKNAEATWDVTGPNGVPEGWTIDVVN